jgi:tetratricopeptide (TPR) repeat protein
MKKHIPLIIGSAAIAGMLHAAPAPAQPAGYRPVSAKEVQQMVEMAYAQARQFIESGQYEQAVSQLNSLIGRFDDSPASKDPSNRVDAALYWKAYSEAKQRKTEDALETIEELKDKFASSSWLKDAIALSLEVQQSLGRTVSPDQPDEDLKLMALRSLMQTDPERGVPLVDQVLKSNNSTKVKENALFVLSQSRTPAAREILARIARDTANPDLQLKALRYLGVSRSADNSRLLEETYRSSSDERVKRAIIRSYMTSGDRTRLASIANDNNSSVSLRGEAIRNLGMLRADDELVRIYARETTPELKKRAIEGLHMANNAVRLVELARAEKDPEMKREIVRRLSTMRSKEATDYMVELLK